MKPKILLVDNVPEFLGIQARLLKQEGYDVLTASDIAEAEAFLKQDWFHLVIIDQRMEDEDNEHDISGLVLARKEEFRSIPKIILTAYPDYESAVGALGTVKGYPSAFDYIAKQKGPKALSEAVAHFFSHLVRINWDLAIDGKARDPLALVNLIEPGLEGERLLNRAEELDDLFRRLFYEKNHIRIDHLLWQSGGQVALIVFAFNKGVKPESFVVVCGQNTIVSEEAQRFEQFAPKAPGETGTILSMKAETTHFATNAYTVVGNDLEKVQTLSEQYRFAKEKVLKDTMTILFQNTLQEWHQDKPILKKNASLESFYRQRLELSEEYFSRADFDERIKVIESQIATIGPRIVHTEGDTLIFHFSHQSFSFPDPLLAFSPTSASDQKETVLAISVPGRLTGENILTDESGHAWLTYFADAGLAPLFWNFVAMEAAIRFDWVETNDLLRRQEMEQCLINTDFAKPDTRGLEPIIGKPARAIAGIRKLAARAVGQDVLDYHLGIFFHAARRLADFDPALPLTSSELARLGQILLSMAMIAGKLGLGQVKADGQLVMIPVRSDQIILADEKARIVMIGDRKERLTPQPFEVFRHLYLHANEVCSKEELLKVALKGDYDERNLHTLISRIRKVIEDDPEHPLYLITEPNAGYRLILKPEI